MAFANDGAASVPGVLRVFAETRDGQPLRAAASTPATRSRAGCGSRRSCLPRGMGGSEVRLRAELEVKGGRRPVRWACAQPLDDGGAFVVRLKKHDDPDWRKGI